jgi:hypothetical protein
MRSIAVINCFLFGLLFCGCRQSPVESAPVEKDPKLTREVFDIKKYPALTAVGRMNLIGQRWCSLILVAEDIGVTAGHCFLKSNFRFDLTKDLEPFATAVIFKPDGSGRIANISVKRILTAKMEPDYAIVKLNKKIPASEIRPLKISGLNLDEMRTNEEQLGCAGFNGDKELGSEGLLMTISRNIKIIPETSSRNRIDTNCYSTYGGSGGLFFKEKNDPETNLEEYDFVGVIWGMTDEKLNENGELVKDENIVTSITPASVFYDELTAIINKN